MKIVVPQHKANPHGYQLPLLEGWPWSTASAQHDHRVVVRGPFDTEPVDLGLLEAAVVRIPRVDLREPAAGRLAAALAKGTRSSPVLGSQA